MQIRSPKDGSHITQEQAHVLIGGKVMKRKGQLVGVDWARLTRLGNEARERAHRNANVPTSRV